jgi:carboxymethylenebutenolidase
MRRVWLFGVLLSGILLAQDKPKDGPTGAISEEEFKALHQLTDKKAPEPKGKMIDLDGSRAYLSLPEGKPPFPGVVVVHEWWGLNGHIEHWADRLAADGYAALAVDLYGGKVAESREDAMAYMKAVDADKAIAILKRAYAFLKDDPRVKASKRGSIGWCFGGGWSLRLAIAEPDLDAAVMYYGQPVLDQAELKRIHAPLLGIFANRDRAFTPEIVDAFDKALTEAQVKHKILRYDADHAFANPSGARYDEKAAAAAWAEARAFLAEHLK